MPYKKQGNWYTNVRWQIGERRGRERRKIGPLKAEATAAEAKIRTQLADGTYVPPEDRVIEEPQSVLFADFCREKFLPWSGSEHGAGHHHQQVRIVETHLIPYFADRHLHEITRADIEQYKTLRRGSRYRVPNWKRSKPVQAPTVNRELACISSIFRRAVEWGSLEASPCAQVKQLKEPKNPPRLLEKAEIAGLLLCTPDHLRALVGTAAYAGLRRQELFNLEWRDVDLKNGTLTVAPQGERRSTKNNRIRRIPINAELRELLERHPIRLGTKLVFPNRAGNSYYKIDRQLTEAAKNAGIEDGMGLHQLRHAFCSHALMDGIDPRTIQQWMGHNDLSTTLRYAHVSPAHEQEAMARLSYKIEPEEEQQTG